MIWVGFATGSGSISSKVSWIRIGQNNTDGSGSETLFNQRGNLEIEHDNISDVSRAKGHIFKQFVNNASWTFFYFISFEGRGFWYRDNSWTWSSGSSGEAHVLILQYVSFLYMYLSSFIFFHSSPFLYLHSFIYLYFLITTHSSQQFFTFIHLFIFSYYHTFIRQSFTFTWHLFTFSHIYTT